MKSLREQIQSRCKHFNGLPHGTERDSKRCNAGVCYYDLMRVQELGGLGCALRMPCTGREPGTVVRGQTVVACEHRAFPSEAEVQAEIDEHERLVQTLKAGKSPCCSADIDTRHVIQEGQHKNHGLRFCSECKRVVFMV